MPETPNDREPDHAPHLDGDELAGRDHAREALSQAKADARRRGVVPGTPARGGRRSRTEPGRRAHNEDPRPMSDVLGRFVADQGWRERAAVGAVFGRWDQIVGPDLAEHTRPESFTDGEVVVRADSAAWATQIRLLAGSLVRRLNEELGHGTVSSVKVTGPGSGEKLRWVRG